MSYANLLTDRCDIYHLKEQKEAEANRFGVPIEDYQPKFQYEKDADLKEVRCYFSDENQSITQGAPNKVIVQSFLVHFLPTTDVRVNSKVMWEGVEYILQKPRKIKNHHIEVRAVRSESL